MDKDIINLEDYKKFRNLKPYRNKTDEEFKQAMLERMKARVTIVEPTKERAAGKEKPISEDYEKRLNAKLNQLKKEYEIDMNDSNDAENLKNLVRQQIQLEKITLDIDSIQSKDRMTQEDYLNLDKLGKIQSSVLSSIGALEDKLGISRKFRKEKKTDDLPSFIEELKKRAKTYYDKQTTPIYCPKCQIELVRLWLNFPNLKNDIDMSLECWKCHETVLWSR